MPRKTNDSFSAEGAGLLASDIREYWRNRGHRVKVWLEELILDPKDKESTGLFVIRSNLVNGRPAPTE